MQKETIEIKQVHDNDKYIIKREIIEEVNGKEILKIYEDIEKGLEEARIQLDDLPEQIKKRTEVLQGDFDTLVERRDTFKKHAEKLKGDKQ